MPDFPFSPGPVPPQLLKVDHQTGECLPYMWGIELSQDDDATARRLRCRGEQSPHECNEIQPSSVRYFADLARYTPWPVATKLTAANHGLGAVPGYIRTRARSTMALAFQWGKGLFGRLVSSPGSRSSIRSEIETVLTTCFGQGGGLPLVQKTVANVGAFLRRRPDPPGCQPSNG